uniref:Uncharacterized protein n=1 Tax=Caenorhabditis japonica TaxID=281687 RepID=A0A8R1IVJ5_CAEJA
MTERLMNRGIASADMKALLADRGWNVYLTSGETLPDIVAVSPAYGLLCISLAGSDDGMVALNRQVANLRALDGSLQRLLVHRVSVARSAITREAKQLAPDEALRGDWLDRLPSRKVDAQAVEALDRALRPRIELSLPRRTRPPR